MKKFQGELQTTAGKDTGNVMAVFAEMYQQNLPKVFQYINYRVDDVHLAEDLTSMVFEKALTRFNSYRSDLASLSTWLLSIARNTVTDHFRASAREQKAMRNMAEMTSMSDPSSDDKTIEVEEQQRLKFCLAGLSTQEQEIISLKFGGELTNRRIAVMLGLSESNVGTIVYRAVRKLRDCFKEWQNGQGI